MKECPICKKEHLGEYGSGRFCSRSCSNTRTFSDESNLKKSLSNKGTIPWNKGKELRWLTSTCLYCGGSIRHLMSSKRKYHNECWVKTSGGLRKGSGRGKSGWYKGYWCDSRYELAWVIYQLEHNYPFERNKVEYEYEWDGKIKKYLPDFIQNGVTIEIKGFINNQTQAKIDSVPNLKVLSKPDLKNEFEYVENKFGKNFIELYEGNPYKSKKNKCKMCGEPASNIYCSQSCSGTGNNKNSKIKDQ